VIRGRQSVKDFIDKIHGNFGDFLREVGITAANNSQQRVPVPIGRAGPSGTLMAVRLMLRTSQK
jgi:hypothetical protein